MKLLSERIETVEYKVETLNEASGNKKAYFIEGVFAQSNQKNRNGRVYPRSVMEGAMGQYGEMITTKKALGELGHPQGPQINLDRVSHLVTEMKWDGDNLVGRAKILDTPNGRIVQNFIDEGIQIGVSTRGLGTVKATKGGINEVQNDFRMAAVDIVADPSAHDAWVQGLYEGKEWVMVNGVWTQQDAETIRENLKNAATLKEAKVAAIGALIKGLGRGF